MAAMVVMEATDQGLTQLHLYLCLTPASIRIHMDIRMGIRMEVLELTLLPLSVPWALEVIRTARTALMHTTAVLDSMPFQL